MFLLLYLIMAGSMNVHAQKARNRRMGIKADSIIQVKDSLAADSLKLLEERLKIENMEAPVDTAALVRKNDSIQKAMAAETKPAGSAIRVPTFTTSPFATIGFAGAPMCCPSKITAFAGTSAVIIG